jgi:transcriptional regulator with XRE-family HTH domain
MRLHEKECNAIAYGMDTITPASIRTRATAAHVSINKLMKRAGLPNSTFWRWEGGKIETPHPVTVQKISDALDAIEAERGA